MEVDAVAVLDLAQDRIGELELEVLTLKVAVDQQAKDLAEARAALVAIETHRANEQVAPLD
jgi:tartrate dehydratase beta subunit/fumarate hydratase class I family protein